MTNPKLIFIMGNGRSGSTVLDIILGNHPGIESVGEVHGLQRSGWVPDDSWRCACGLPLYRCPFWTEVHQSWTARVGGEDIGVYLALQDRFDYCRSSRIRLLFESKRRSAQFVRYSKMTSAFYQAICEVSGKAIVVDSSKRPSRAYALSINDDIDLLLIHLIRDGRGVVWSRAKSFKKDIEAGIPGDIPATPAWRTSLRWVLRNLESEWVVSRTEAHKALRVRYEQFVENPGPILEKIGALVCQDLSQLSNDLVSGKAMKVGHNVGGNRLRMSGHIVLRPKLEWERELPAADKRTFWRIGGWLARRYGYRP